MHAAAQLPRPYLAIRAPGGRQEWAAVVAALIAGAYLIALLLDSDTPIGLALARSAIVAAVTVATIFLTLRPWDAASPRASLRADRTASRPVAGSALGGLLALILGTVAFVAGAAAGVANLAMVGLSAGGLFGVAALVAGLVLSVEGTWWLVRPLRRVPRLVAAVAGFVLVAQFWLFPLAAGVLSTHAPRSPFEAAVPPGTANVTFRAADGTALAGWYTPSANGATVIVLPGAGGTKAETSAQAQVLTRNGFGVLAMDPRGSGESGGHAMLYGWGGESDLSAAVTFLVSRPEVDAGRIGVLGLSMGGEIAITGAASDSRLKAVVAEGATARTCGDQTYLGGDLEGFIHHFDSCLGWVIAGVLTGAPEPATLRDNLTKLGSRPVLLIAADDSEEHAATNAFRSVSPSTIQLWQPVGASHTGALSMYPQEWERRVVEFLRSSL